MNTDILTQRGFNAQDETARRFYMVDKTLFENEHYKGLDMGVKLFYSILVDRLELSKKNGWMDENRIYYLEFTVESLMKLCEVSNKTVIKYKKELEKYGLLYQKQMGKNIANRLYPLKVLPRPNEEKRSSIEPETEKSVGMKKIHILENQRKCKKYISKNNQENQRKCKKYTPVEKRLEVKKVHTNDTNIYLLKKDDDDDDDKSSRQTKIEIPQKQKKQNNPKTDDGLIITILDQNGFSKYIQNKVKKELDGHDHHLLTEKQINGVINRFRNEINKGKKITHVANYLVGCFINDIEKTKQGEKAEPIPNEPEPLSKPRSHPNKSPGGLKPQQQQRPKIPMIGFFEEYEKQQQEQKQKEEQRKKERESKPNEQVWKEIDEMLLALGEKRK